MAQILRRIRQQEAEQVLGISRQQPGSSRSAPVGQRGRFGDARIGGDPVGDTLSGYPKQIGDRSGGAAAGKFQDGQGAPVKASIRRRGELAAKLVPLPKS